MLVEKSQNTALVWRDQEISYNELLQFSACYADLFRGEETSKIAIFSENRPEWIYAFYAGWKNNCVVVPIDFMAPAEDVAYMLNDCRPEVIFCSRDLAPTFEKSREQLQYDIQVFILDDLEKTADAYKAESIAMPDVNETAVIIYTSGTTGSPKGVMLSFDNLLANIEAVSEDIPIFTSERRVLALLPFHHIFPLMGTMIAPLSVGGKIAFSPSMNSEDIIGTLQKNQINIIIGVPRLYAAIRKGIMDQINRIFITRLLFNMAAKINSRAFSKKLFKKVHQKFGGHIDYLVCGGAKLDEAIASDFKTLGFEMLEGFGMTEAAPMITFTRPGKWKIGSAGQAMPCLEVTSKDGEIVAKGRNIMQGYYNRPEETDAVLKDGWLHTGDLGHVDDEGFIHITGRAKEIIVLSSGKNINPEEIENKIAGLSGLVAEVGVFPDNDQLHAAIYPDFKKLKEEGLVNIEEFFRWEIIDKYNRKAAGYKKISKLILLKEELPKTRLGKIQRFLLPELNEKAGARQKSKTPEPQFEEYLVIKNFLSEQTSNEISPDDHIEIDLGLDSLDKVSLISFLQSTFGVELKEDVLINHPTIEKLSHFMKEKKNKFTVEAVKWTEIFKEKVELNLPKSWFTQNLFKHVSKSLMRFYFRLRGEGVHNLPRGPFILAPNHQSFLDGLFVSVFLDNKVMKNTYFYAKEKHIRNRWLRALAHRNNIIIMDINRDLKHSLQKLAEVLRKGKNVMIFPEGTRTQNGKIGNFKKAFAILSRELNVPVVPVSIKGAFEAMPKGRLIPKPWKKIDVKFLEPVYPANFDYDALTEQVYSRLAMDEGR